MKKLKIGIAFIVTAVLILLKDQAFASSHGIESILSGLLSLLTQIRNVPLSVVYILISAMFIYLLPRISFFKNIKFSISTKERKKFTVRDTWSVIIFGLIIVLIMIGFIVIMFTSIK